MASLPSGQPDNEGVVVVVVVVVVVCSVKYLGREPSEDGESRVAASKTLPEVLLKEPRCLVPHPHL